MQLGLRHRPFAPKKLGLARPTRASVCMQISRDLKLGDHGVIRSLLRNGYEDGICRNTHITPSKHAHGTAHNPGRTPTDRPQLLASGSLIGSKCAPPALSPVLPGLRAQPRHLSRSTGMSAAIRAFASPSSLATTGPQVGARDFTARPRSSAQGRSGCGRGPRGGTRRRAARPWRARGAPCPRAASPL